MFNLFDFNLAEFNYDNAISAMVKDDEPVLYSDIDIDIPLGGPKVDYPQTLSFEPV